MKYWFVDFQTIKVLINNMSKLWNKSNCEFCFTNVSSHQYIEVLKNFIEKHHILLDCLQSHVNSNVSLCDAIDFPYKNAAFNKTGCSSCYSKYTDLLRYIDKNRHLPTLPLFFRYINSLFSVSMSKYGIIRPIAFAETSKICSHAHACRLKNISDVHVRCRHLSIRGRSSSLSHRRCCSTVVRRCVTRKTKSKSTVNREWWPVLCPMSARFSADRLAHITTAIILAVAYRPPMAFTNRTRARYIATTCRFHRRPCCSRFPQTIIIIRFTLLGSRVLFSVFSCDFVWVHFLSCSISCDCPRCSQFIDYRFVIIIIVIVITRIITFFFLLFFDLIKLVPG